MSEILKIDVDKVLRERLPGTYRYLPRFVVRWLERLICQDRLNQVLEAVGDREGVEAATAMLDDLNVSVTATGIDQVPGDGRYIFASNHPLGGLDGLALMSVIGKRYAGNIRFIVNDLLMAVKPLRPILLPVNKHGRQARNYAVDIDAELAGDNQVITFPAGLCSRLMDDGSIADLEWHKSFVAHAVKDHRDVIPVYFDGHNSRWFYRLARWRKKLGIRFNYEMILLPREMIKSQGRTYNVYFGEPVSYRSLEGDTTSAIARLRNLTYSLAPTPSRQ